VLEYDLTLEVDYSTNAFRGKLGISGATEPGPIELDSVELDIQGVEGPEGPLPFELLPEAGKLVIPQTQRSLNAFMVTFSGHAGEAVQTGLFVTRIGQHKALTTQMEPESCRRLIPCFDRPDRKARFKLTVVTDAELVVISNMPAETRPLPNGQKVWAFSATPPMSSYLLYLGVAPFEETTNYDGPFPVISAGVKGRRAEGERTLRVARDVLRGFTDYFDLPFPLPKLHFVSFADFWAGMENWGAITGSEDLYLLSEAASAYSLMVSDEVITHEIAHQWFGNLVTLRTWDELWLNESFATFAVPLVQDHAHLRQDPWAEFVMRTVRGDLLDSLWSAHPVKPTSYLPSEIIANADAITYSKGARLIRMVQGFLGNDEFRDGISEYLRDHEFKNATSDDLWETLEEESGKPVTKVMRPWVERPGHPCITIRQAGSGVELSQRRFTFVPRPGPETPWPIPLRWEDGDASGFLVFDSDRVTLPDRRADTLRIDPGRSGFLRILWAPELRARAIARLPSLPSADRAAFVHDAFGFLRSGDYSLDEHLSVLHEVTSATDRLTVEETAQSLDLLFPVLSDVPRYHRAAREFCRTQMARLTERGSPGEPEGWDVVREWVSWVGVKVDPEYAHSLASRFKSIDKQPAAIRQSIASAYALKGASESGPSLLSRATGSDSDAATQAAFALGDITDPDRLITNLNIGLGTVPLVGLMIYWIPSAARHPEVRPALWDWLRQNFRELERRAKGSPLLSAVAERSLPYLGIGRADPVKAYFEQESFPEALPGIQRGLELLEAHVRMRERVVGNSI
jgi:tricorn protease interacting factor F2/3